MGVLCSQESCEGPQRLQVWDVRGRRHHATLDVPGTFSISELQVGHAESVSQSSYHFPCFCIQCCNGSAYVGTSGYEVLRFDLDSGDCVWKLSQMERYTVGSG